METPCAVEECNKEDGDTLILEIAPGKTIIIPLCPDCRHTTENCECLIYKTKSV